MPDYEIQVDGIEIAVEVKQIEPNAGDQHILAPLAHRKATAYFVDMSRAHQSILDAAKQLRAYAKGAKPAIAVLYDTVGLLGYLDADSIARCLYGPALLHIAIPNDPNREPWVLGNSYGGGRVATEHHNTTLSAVGVLRVTGESDSVSLYHNAFAALPIDPHRFRFDGVRHLAWRAPDAKHLPSWVDITSTPE